MHLDILYIWGRHSFPCSSATLFSQHVNICSLSEFFSFSFFLSFFLLELNLFETISAGTLHDVFDAGTSPPDLRRGSTSVDGILPNELVFFPSLHWMRSTSFDCFFTYHSRDRVHLSSRSDCPNPSSSPSRVLAKRGIRVGTRSSHARRMDALSSGALEQ